MKHKLFKKALASILSACLVLGTLTVGTFSAAAADDNVIEEEMPEMPEVVSIEASDTTVYSGFDFGYEVLEDDEFQEVQKYAYTPEIKVTLADGSVKELEVYFTYNGGLDEDGRFYPLEFEDDQDGKTPWALGDHKVTLTCNGVSTSFVVTVKELIESIEVAPITVYQGLDLTTDYDFDTDSEYTYFTYEVLDYTVTLKDGSVIQSDEYGYFTYDDREFSIESEDNQSAKRVWKLGDHSVKFTCGDYSGRFTVTVAENPVESIEFDPATVIQGSSELPNNLSFHVHLTDGTVADSVDGEAEFLGRTYGYTSDFETDCEEEFSTLGKKTVAVSLVNFYSEADGIASTVEVTVVENPVKSISFEPVEIIENTSYSMYPAFDDEEYYEDYNYDEDEDEDDDDYYYEDEELYFKHYEYSPAFTVTMKDGTTWHYDMYEDFEYEGVTYSLEVIDDQAYENEWSVGKHKAQGKLFDLTGDIEVNIIENPYTALKSFSIKNAAAEGEIMPAFLVDYVLVDKDGNETHDQAFVLSLGFFGMIATDDYICEPDFAVDETGAGSYDDVSLKLKIAGFDAEAKLSEMEKVNIESGDVNFDGKVDITDATLVQMNAAHIYSFTSIQETLADMNEDFKADITDATLIQMQAAGLINNE